MQNKSEFKPNPVSESKKVVRYYGAEPRSSTYGQCMEREEALEAFANEIRQFLNTYQISNQKCDIVEDTILRLAGAEFLSPGSVYYWLHSLDFDVTFTDIDKENTTKVVNYLSNLATEKGYQGVDNHPRGAQKLMEKFGLIQDSKDSKACVEAVCSSNLLQSHRILIDGSFFYKEVFPKIKKYIEQMDKGLLKKYQDLSQDLFPQKPIQVSPISMFQAQKPTNNVPEAINHLSM